MGKRRIEQVLGNELWILGDCFNERYPRKTPIFPLITGLPLIPHAILTKEQTFDLLKEQVEVLVDHEKKDRLEIRRQAIDVALTALMIAGLVQRDSK